MKAAHRKGDKMKRYRIFEPESMTKQDIMAYSLDGAMREAERWLVKQFGLSDGGPARRIAYVTAILEDGLPGRVGLVAYQPVVYDQ
jgi:hypothetical protein